MYFAREEPFLYWPGQVMIKAISPGRMRGRGVNQRPHLKTGNPGYQSARVQCSKSSTEEGRYETA